ncbi:MAG: DUF4259 domain-containing protein [Verrucomicrobiota bacterium]
MGAWDATSFGNDTASDWAYGLEECDDFSYIDDTLQKILDEGGGYIDAGDGAEAVAAAEVVAWLLGRAIPADAYTESVADWVAAHSIPPPPELVSKALAVLHRIQGKSSELSELWGNDGEWITSMADLRTRLTV